MARWLHGFVQTVTMAMHQRRLASQHEGMRKRLPLLAGHPSRSARSPSSHGLRSLRSPPRRGWISATICID